MDICRYCNQEYQSGWPNHAKQCNKYRQWKEDVITYNFLYEEFLKQEKSANQIAKELGLSTSTAVNRRLTQLGFTNRTIAEASKKTKVKEQQKYTNQSKYGADHNFCRSHPSRIKWQQRLLLEEGITNVFQRVEVKQKIAQRIRDGSKQIRGSRISSIHKQVYDMLIESNIKCTNEYTLRYDNNSFYFYDIHISNTNIILEINGNYYHANPLMYKQDDIIYFPRQTIGTNVKDIWNRDNKKLSTAIKHNYHVIVIWEHEIKKNWHNTKQEIVRIIEELKNGSNTKDNQSNKPSIQTVRCSSS